MLEGDVRGEVVVGGRVSVLKPIGEDPPGSIEHPLREVDLPVAGIAKLHEVVVRAGRGSPECSLRFH